MRSWIVQFVRYLAVGLVLLGVVTVVVWVFNSHEQKKVASSASTVTPVSPAPKDPQARSAVPKYPSGGPSSMPGQPIRPPKASETDEKPVTILPKAVVDRLMVVFTAFASSVPTDVNTVDHMVKLKQVAPSVLANIKGRLKSSDPNTSTQVIHNGVIVKNGWTPLEGNTYRLTVYVTTKSVYTPVTAAGKTVKKSTDTQIVAYSADVIKTAKEWQITKVGYVVGGS